MLRGLASASAFMVPGLALWLPSGYSYGAALLLLGALFGAPWWWRECKVSRQSAWLLASIILMGCVWLLDSTETAWRWGTMDRPSKYLLALPCLFFLLAFAPQPRYLWAGIAVGALGGGAEALYQVGMLNMPRAAGYTNAIQYGNLSMLLALMCLVLIAARPPGLRPWHRLALVLGVIGGLVGSVLSQSRGGWVALVLVLPLLATVLWPFMNWRRLVGGASALLCVVVAVAFVERQGMENRLDEARSEVQRYESRGDAGSSVGQRLAHWQLAWNMGLDRPLLGWGKSGYDAEKQRRVDAKLAHPFVLQFAHAHNEVLDVFVKHGLLGVLALVLFYGVPLAIFWPTRARVMRQEGAAQGEVDRTRLALHLVGWIIPVAYIGFGLTQVFFAHNSGNLFYLFMVMLVHSALEKTHPLARFDTRGLAKPDSRCSLEGGVHAPSDGHQRGT